MSMIAVAVKNGMSPDTIRDLMNLQREWEAAEAKKAFVSAMSAFKADPPQLFKNKQVSFETSKGRTEYMHATLDQVALSIGSKLAPHGLSFRWATEQKDNGQIKVTCFLTHERGHSESVWLESGRDESGGKNNIQALGSTVTYLERYTLLAVTGMAVKDQDDDGHSAEPKQETKPTITDAQKSEWTKQIDDCAELTALSEIGKAITAACQKVNDLETYNSFKTLVSSRRAELRPAK